MKLTDKLTITNEDNMQLMARYPDNYFDLAIVDPPYGIDIETSGTYFKQFKTKGWDNATPNNEYFEELKRVSKNQIIWGGNYFLEYLGSAKCFLIWDKMIGEGMSFADGEIAWTSFKKPTRIKKLLSRSENGKIHPTQKPVDLYKWILDKYAICQYCENTGSYMEDVAGDGGSRLEQPCDCVICDEDNVRNFRILDTHLGSGSIAIACHDYGFELTACELDEEYYENAIQRIKNHVAQQKLF